jgi:hypothetical protein
LLEFVLKKKQVKQKKCGYLLAKIANIVRDVLNDNLFSEKIKFFLVQLNRRETNSNKRRDIIVILFFVEQLYALFAGTNSTPIEMDPNTKCGGYRETPFIGYSIVDNH